jgi:hypothetical protein
VVVVIGWKGKIPSNAGHPGRKPLQKLVTVTQGGSPCFSGRGNYAQVTLRDKVDQVNVLVGDHASRTLIARSLTIARSLDQAR